uniref:hypothetical protein n=1 Tax=Clostridium sp. NkU-1 TaxID=1095009 RepID=UPI0006D12B7F
MAGGNDAAVMSMTLAACGGSASTSGGTTAAGSTEAADTKAAAEGGKQSSPYGMHGRRKRGGNRSSGEGL